MLPGSNFGRPHEEMTTRIVHADFDGKSALEFVRSLDGDHPLDVSFLITYCGNVLEAKDRLCAWRRADIPPRGLIYRSIGS
jgi:hypothetical protein